MPLRNKSAKKTGVLRKVRKPIPPPTRVVEDDRKYDRAKEHERERRSNRSAETK